MRALHPILGLGLLCVACSSDVPDTGRGEPVHQEVVRASYSAATPLDVIVVMNDESAALRADVAESVRVRVRQLAGGDGVPWRMGQLTNPIDVRAFIATADGTIHSPVENPRLVWHEPDAAPGSLAAESFAKAVDEELSTRLPIAAPRTEGLVNAMLASVLAKAATAEDRRRVIVVASTEDDASAPVVDGNLRTSDTLAVVVPSRSDACEPRATPHLEAWVRARGAIMHPCRGIQLRDLVSSYNRNCLFRGRTTASSLHCRVRALVPPGTPCDAARGWRASEPGACEVSPLAGDDDRKCREDERYAGTASGWCLPPAEASCRLGPRLFGSAAPPWATIETTCNLDE